ncbi:MAG: isoaspartyl peptidase/L-asparaginase [Bacteroidia bacterium]|nr:isoaspartyl peptidase/L-asparaginase [Bacteroidia bacterium]
MNNHLFSIAIHGGAGTILKSEMTPKKEKNYRDALQEAIFAGIAILKNGGSAENAVVTAVTVLENCDLFNAGKGSVFTHEGTHEMDASLMEGLTLRAGAVAGVKHIRNPIILAQSVMNLSPHVLLLGEGAERFAESIGMEKVPQEYFSTELRKKQLEAIRNSGKVALDHSVSEEIHKKRGTVGAVARDKAGNLAAATSTGGMTNKRFGRVGDTPLIGAGTYASNQSCAVSATGWGEFFIRGVVAYDVAALILYNKFSLQEAVRHVIHDKLGKLSPIEGEYGDGGLISVDNQGNIVMDFNTPGMYRASCKEGEPVFTGLYEY